MTLDPARVFATLDRHGVDYVTIGAFAVIAHGYVRATADIDLVARQDRDNLERLAAAFADLHARRRGVDADLLEIDPTDPDTLANGASFTLDTDAGPVDYLNDVPGAGDYDGLRARAIEATAADVVVGVAGLDDLIRMKRASGRTQDLRDIANLSPGPPRVSTRAHDSPRCRPYELMADDRRVSVRRAPIPSQAGRPGRRRNRYPETGHRCRPHGPHGGT